MNQVVKINVKKCETFKDQLLGKLIYQDNLFFKTRFGIHTCFLKEPIDVLVISEKGKVQSLKQNLRPWRLFFWNPKYFQVIELPGGYIKEKKLQLGDTIRVA